MYYDIMKDTPIGDLLIVVHEDGALAEICFDARRRAGTGQLQRDPAACAAVREQLLAYFEGTRRAFDLPLRPDGTPYQQRVWTALCEVPYGTTCSYGDLASRVGDTHPRAVGAANGANPIPIVVPCHRVIGADGSLTGYAGGLRIKQALLNLEGAIPLQASLA